MAGVLSSVTRLWAFDCSRDLEIVRNLRCTVCRRRLLEQENVILQLLVDEVLIAMRLKTYLL